jgi:hypothetical protein
MKILTDDQMKEMLQNISEEVVRDWGGGCSTHQDFVALAADAAAKVFLEAYKQLRDLG